MSEFKVAQIPSSRAVKRNLQPFKLKPYTAKQISQGIFLLKQYLQS